MRPSSKQRVNPETPPKSNQKLACEECGCETNHRVLSSVEEYDESPHGDVMVWVAHWVVRCLGCNTLAFCRRTNCSEDMTYDHRGNQSFIPHVELLPHRLPGRQRQEYGKEVPEEIRVLYEETYTALCNDLYVLAGIGMRAILEMVCKDKQAEGPKLYVKVNDLGKKGIVVRADAETLQNLRFLGNESAHEAAAHASEELIAGLDVIEHLLASLYVVPVEAKKIPARPARA